METKKVSWNASEGLIMEICNRRAMANTHYINGNMRKAFTTLITIKQSVIQSFAVDEREQLKEIETKFNTISSALYPSGSSSFNPIVRNAYQQALFISKKFYALYNDLLMDLLEKYGYLIGEQTDASMMKF